MASPYEVAIHLTVSGNAQAGLAAAGQQINKLNEGVEKLHKAFALLFVGGEMKRWGEDTLGYVRKVIDASGELSHELAKMKTLGITPQQFDQAKAAAIALPGQVPGVTSVDAAKIYSSIYSMFGSDEAIKMMKSIATFSQVLGSQTGKYDQAADSVLAMIRAGDLMGKFVDSVTHKVDTAKLEHFLDLGTKVITATHGVVSPQTWFQLAQQGGPALAGMTDEGLLSMAIAAQAMKGPRAGTALFSTFSQFVGGRMLKNQAEKLEALGLIGPHTGSGLSMVWPAGSLNTPVVEALKKDPMAAVKIIQDSLAAHGFTTIEQQVPKLFEILGRQTTVRLVHDLLRNMPQILAERGRIAGGLGISASAALKNIEDWEQAVHNLDAAFRELMIQTGFPAVQALIPFLKNLGDAILIFANVVTAHPDAAKNVLAFATGFGAVMTALGVLAVGAGIAGLLGTGVIIVGLTALTGGLAGLAAANWSAVSSGIQGLIDKLNALSDMCRGAVVKIGEAIAWLLEKIESLNPFHHASFGGGGFGGGGGGLTNASYEGGTTDGGGGGVNFGNIRVPGTSHSFQHFASESDAAHAITRLAAGYRTKYGVDTPAGILMHYSPPSENQTAQLIRNFQRRTGLGANQHLDFSNPDTAARFAYGIAVQEGKAGRRSLEHFRHLYSPRGKETHVHNNIYLDGKMIAKSTSKHLVRAAQYPTSVGRQDGRGTFMGPGAEVFA